MRVIVLPGLDGTGELLDVFAAALAPEFDAQIIPYPSDQMLGYADLTQLVIAAMPGKEPFLLVAESFSGPIALRLAATRPDNLAGLVLCASFAKAPLRRLFSPFVLGRLMRHFPIQRVPTRMMMPMLMGKWSSPDWRRRVQASLSGVARNVIGHRLREVLRVDETRSLGHGTCPLLYLRALHDRLVPVRCRDTIVSVRSDTVCVDVDGPHFLLQAQPGQCAALIKRAFP